MTEKKIIKIQSDSEEVKKDESPAAAVENQQPDPGGAPAAAETQEATAAGTEQVVDPVKDLEEKLRLKEAEASENYDRLLRVSAEFENYKKRAAREMEDFRKFSNQSLI